MKQGAAEIILQIENALGVYNCFNLIKASPRVAATCFGSARDGDLQSDLGCSWSIEGTELLYARSKVLLDTRAAGGHVLPLDGVFADLNDEAGLIADSRLSARLGYIGRTVIHPKQIAPVKAAYAVPEAEVAYYKKIVGRIRRRRKKPASPPSLSMASWSTTPWPSAPAACSRSPASTRRGDAMDFSFTPDQETLRAHVKELLDDVCPPDYAERCDNEARPPREAYQALAKHGWFGLAIPAEYGGTGGSAIDLAILAGRNRPPLRRTGDVAVPHAHLRRLRRVARRHARSRKRDLLPKIVRGELSFCFGLTEPASGSDAAALTTRAKAVDGGFIIDGQKVFTSGMDISDYCLLITRTSTGEQETAGHHQFPRRYQAARHRGAQDRDARPARHRHHAGLLQRREGAGLRRARQSRSRLGSGRLLSLVRAALPVRRAHRRGLGGVRLCARLRQEPQAVRPADRRSSRRSRTSSPT